MNRHIKRVSKFLRISDQRLEKIRIEVLLWVFVATIVIVSLHIAIDKPDSVLDFLKKFFGGWPVGALGISFTLILLWFVDGVRDKAELIEETLQRRLTSFEEIHEQALRLLEWVTVTDPTKSPNLIPKKTAFYMTSAAPVFGLEENLPTREKWMELLRQRGAGHAETNLFCYSWQAPNGIEESALGRFSKKLAQTGGTSMSWYQACVMAWDQYDKLFPAGHADRKDKALKVYLIDEPDFGVIYARHSDGNEKAIIYISNSHSISRDAVAFSTKDENWLGLIKLTFKAQIELNKLALLEFPQRGPAEAFRDKQLYKEFEEHGDKQREEELTYRSSTDRKGDAIPIAVFPGVFPPKMGLDTSYVIRALNIVLPRLGELVKAGTKHEGHQIDSILGVDVGTGTGVLALVMAMHKMPKEYPITVVATDNYGPAIKNASLNFRRAAELSPALAEALKLKGKIEGKLSKAEIRKKYQRNEIRDGDICVINCDLAQLVHRTNDNEMMLFVFNYPAYQSPSNIFNTGGKRAGKIIVEEFLKDLYERLRPSDIILLPEITISVGASISLVQVADLAEKFEYCCMPISVGGQDADSVGEVHVTVKVFALAKAAKKGDLDWRQHPFLSLMHDNLPDHKGLDGPVLR